MKNNPQKEIQIELAIDYINGDIKKLNRQWFRDNVESFSEYKITKLFGSFSNFKREVLLRLDNDADNIDDSSLTKTPYTKPISLSDLSSFNEDQEYDKTDYLFDLEEFNTDLKEFNTDLEEFEEAPNIDNSNLETESYLDDNYADQEELLFAYANDGYIDKGEYWFNPSTKDYLFDFTHIPSIAKPIIIPNTQLYAILQDYSNFDKNPKTINSIAIKQKIPPFILKKILYALSTTHDSLPLTEELLDESPDDDAVIDDLLALRQFGIYEKFNQKVWNQVQTQANKWVNFEKGIYNPIVDTLSTFTLPKFDLIKSDLIDKTKCTNCNNCNEWNNDSYLITLSDIHFGAFANQNNLYKAEDGDWTLEKTQQAIIKYLQDIKNNINSRISKPKDCIIVSLGDLVHCLNGSTDKGTPLITQTVGIPQFKAALDSLTFFFAGLIALWQDSPGNIKIYSVSGNHDSIGDYCLMLALSKIFETKEKIKFEIGTSRWLTFQVHNSLFVIEHGASSKYKSKVPTSDKSKEVYIQKLILDKMDKFTNPITHKYFMMGDLHHYHQKEMSSFEFIQVPTIVKNDEYADALNLRSRPRQLSFIIDNKQGIKETIYHYFD
jgi:hypothetical protein